MILRLINVKEVCDMGIGWAEIQHHIINENGVRICVKTDYHPYIA